MGRGEQLIREHIATVARRDPGEYAVLADALQSVLWPDGGVDRRAHLGDWTGVGPAPLLTSCRCVAGRCLVCN